VNRRTDLVAEVWDVQEVLYLIEDGRLALPDFQRRFEWGVSDVRSFLSTVLAGLPSGSILVSDNYNIQVQLRALEGAPKLWRDPAKISVLLDGQQRLTSLWQATRDIGPERYFVDFHALIDGAELLQDNVIVSTSAYRVAEFLNRASQEGRVLVPISALLTPSHFFSWLHGADRHQWDKFGDDEALGSVFAEHVQSIHTYKVPVTRLAGDLNLSTVAQIFERTNKGGQKLDAFDLLVARLQGAGWSLRFAWEDALRRFPEIGRVFGDNGLSTISAISLLLQSDVRRSAVLSLPPKQVSENWPQAVLATRDVAAILLNEGVRQPELLPYDAIATTMIAAHIAGVPERVLARYFWVSASSLRYEVASNTRILSDFRALTDKGLDSLLGDWSLTQIAIERNTKRSSKALWATLVCLSLSNDPLDLAIGAQLTSNNPEDRDSWELVSLAKGGGFVETERDIPARLRTAGQLLALPGRSGRLQRLGLVQVVRERVNHPELFGPTIEECLRSQFMPPSAVILDKITPRDLISERATRFYSRLRELILNEGPRIVDV
jgi:hypothetical protein